MPTVVTADLSSLFYSLYPAVEYMKDNPPFARIHLAIDPCAHTATAESPVLPLVTRSYGHFLTHFCWEWRKETANGIGTG